MHPDNPPALTDESLARILRPWLPADWRPTVGDTTPETALVWPLPDTRYTLARRATPLGHLILCMRLVWDGDTPDLPDGTMAFGALLWVEDEHGRRYGDESWSLWGLYPESTADAVEAVAPYVREPIGDGVDSYTTWLRKVVDLGPGTLRDLGY